MMPLSRVFAISAVAVAVAAVLTVATVVILDRTDPRNVPESEIVLTPQPDPVQVNDPVEAAPAQAEYSNVLDITSDISRGFAGDLRDVRSRVLSVSAQEAVTPTISVESDRCLLEWAKKHLSELASSGTYAVIEVCDRSTAVLAGPAGADSKVLTYGSLEPSAPEGMRETLAESSAATMALVGVQTEDGQAQLIAAAELP